MAVNNTISTSGPYAGNDVSTSFSVTFNILLSSQVAVFQTDALGVTTQLVETTDYTVTGIPDAPIVNLNVALPTGETLLLVSDYVATQLTELESQGGFFPDTIENVFDKLTYLILQLQRKAMQSDDGTTFFDASSKTVDNLSPAVLGTSAVNKDQLDAVEATAAAKLDSVVAGANVSVDATDPQNPIISAIVAGGDVVELPEGSSLLGQDAGSYFVINGISGPAGVTDYFFTVREAGEQGGNPTNTLVLAHVAVGDGPDSGNIYSYTSSFPGIISGWDFINFQRQELFSTSSPNSSILARGVAQTAATARFYLPINGVSIPTAITLTGQFRVTDARDVIVGGGTLVVPTIDINRVSKRFCVVAVTGLSGLTQDAPLHLVSVDATSKIVVEF